MKCVSYQIFGKVVAEGRGRVVRCGNFTRVATPAATRVGRQEHIAAFQAACEPGWQPWIGPVTLQIIVFRPRPKDWWDGKHCRGKPDLDNVAKLTMDALSGFAYPDDTCVSQLIVRREWSDHESVSVDLMFDVAPEKPRRKPKCTSQA